MQTRQFISGFSDLKNLLIKTYKIEKESDQIKLYFSESENNLILHDYDNHARTIVLVFDVRRKRIEKWLSRSAHLIVERSLMNKAPAKYLNEGFQLYGFFKS